MAVYYFDSSSLVKRYVKEAGSAWVMKIADPGSMNRIYTVRITAVEVISALTRLARGNHITLADSQTAKAQFKSDFLTEYQIVEVSAAVIDQAMVLAEKHGLRGYDAVQLSAAYEIQVLRTANKLPALTFVSADNALNTAAAAERLNIDNPNTHP